MVPQYDFHRLVQELVYGERALAAHTILLAMDEDAVEPLIDEYYAGVNIQVGAAILDILGELGGPEAIATLWNVYHFDDNEPIKQAATRGLLRNRSTLDQDDIEELLRYSKKED